MGICLEIPCTYVLNSNVSYKRTAYIPNWSSNIKITACDRSVFFRLVSIIAMQNCSHEKLTHSQKVASLPVQLKST